MFHDDSERFRLVYGVFWGVLGVLRGVSGVSDVFRKFLERGGSETS